MPSRSFPTHQTEPTPCRFQSWLLVITALSCVLLAVVAVAATVPMGSARHAESSIQRAGASVGNTDSPNPDDYETIDPAHWRSIEMVMEHPNGGTCTITLLRPLPWVTLTSAKAGQSIRLTMPEMGIMGPALVKSVGPCPPGKADFTKPALTGQTYRAVTGTFNTTNAVVLKLFVEGLSEPIWATASHPFYSVDRKGWVAAGDLRPGETLRTDSGTAKFIRAERKPGTETVYNLEVHKNHNFYVSKAKLLVHNNCGDLDALFAAATQADRNGFTFAGRALQKHTSRSAGSVWRTSATTAAEYNSEGERAVMEILTNPRTAIKSSGAGRTQFIHPDGRGVQFNADGSFYSFMN